MKKDVSKAYVALAIVSFFWGTTYIAAKIGAQHIPGLFLAGMRQLLSGALLVGFFLLKGHKIPDWDVLKKITVQSIFLLCISNGLMTWSVEYISGGLASVIAAMVPLFIVLFTVLLSKCTKITWMMLTGLLIGFAGVVVIFYNYLSQLHNKSFLFGITLAIIGTMSWAFGTVYSSKQKTPLNILFNVGLQMLIAGILMLIACGITGKYINLYTADTHSLMALLYLIVFGSLIAYSAYVFMISKLPPAKVSVYAYINPVVAVFCGWLVLAEQMSVNMILGVAITLTGVYLVNLESKKMKQ
jgi:drug/metabolite transporter (DMT)-like permease